MKTCLWLLFVLAISGPVQAQTDTKDTVEKIVTLYNQFSEHPAQVKVQVLAKSESSCKGEVFKVNESIFNKLPADEKINWVFDQLNRCK